MSELSKEISIIDMFLIAFFLISLIHYIHYVCWQFFHLSMSEETMTRIIRALNLFETALFIATRFIAFGFWGRYAWAGFIIGTLIVLIMQYILANWGLAERIETGCWIAYYVELFLIDIMAIDVFGFICKQLGPTFISIDSALNGTWIGELIISVIVVLAKVVFHELLFSKKHANN